MFDFDVRSGRDARVPQMPAGLSMTRAHGDEFTEPVTRVPRRSPVVLSPSCELREALRLMNQQHAGVALVASHGVLLGMLDERELLRRTLDPIPPPGTVPVWKVMVAEPETLLDIDTVAYAVRKLWTLGGRPMPIVRPNGALVGVLETQDLVSWMCDRMGGRGDPRHENGR